MAVEREEVTTPRLKEVEAVVAVLGIMVEEGVEVQMRQIHLALVVAVVPIMFLGLIPHLRRGVARPQPIRETLTTPAKLGKGEVLGQ